VHAPGHIQRLSQWFVAEPGSVPAARRAAESVRGVLGSRVCERVCLLVSELVANAVIHGSERSSDTVRMRIWTTPASVRVAVNDRGPSFERESGPEQLEVGGWGLYLVERLADRWGVRRGAGTEVWFEIDTESAPGPPSPRAASATPA
jgi:anti-sigma regulatory factor (Ser/Thr protein kinase)